MDTLRQMVAMQEMEAMGDDMEGMDDVTMMTQEQVNDFIEEAEFMMREI